MWHHSFPYVFNNLYIALKFVFLAWQVKFGVTRLDGQIGVDSLVIHCSQSFFVICVWWCVTRLKQLLLCSCHFWPYALCLCLRLAAAQIDTRLERSCCWSCDCVTPSGLLIDFWPNTENQQQQQRRRDRAAENTGFWLVQDLFPVKMAEPVTNGVKNLSMQGTVTALVIVFYLSQWLRMKHVLSWWQLHGYCWQ